MDAKNSQKNIAIKRRCRSGQSIIEFAFILPLYIGLIYYLMQINMAINASVVFQQFTRQRILEMLYGHPDYPMLRSTQAAGARQAGWQRFWIGMDRDVWGGTSPEVDDREEGRTPVAMEVRIGSRSPAGGAEEENNFPPQERQIVKIRTINFMCMGPKLYPAAAEAAGQGPQFMTETVNEFVSNSYAGGFGAHIQFCQDN
jgi:hypothetical protein